MVNRRVGNLRKDRDRGGKKGGFFSHYRPPPADHVKRQAERKGGKFDSIFKGNFDTFTPKEGDNTIRILPPGWDGAGDYAYPVWIHWGVGADESAYLCLRKMKNETCPICQEVARMKADGEGEDAKRIDCKERFICWVIDRTDRDETPQLYSMPAGTYKDINALCYSSKSGKAIFVDNPDDGYDVIIRRTGTKINTKYLPQVDREATAVTDDPDKYAELEQWVQDNQIPDCLQYFEADYIERALSGEIDRNKDDDDDRPRRGKGRDQNEDDDEEEAPPRSSGRQRVRTRSRDEEPEDDEEDEAPARRGDRRGRDEDDDDPPPRRGKVRDDDDDDLEDELPFDEDDDGPEAESANEGREARQDRHARGRGRGRDEDDDEPQERPRSNKARSKREEPEDEEDDDPPPRRGRARDEDEDDSPPRSRTRTRDRERGNRRV